MPIYNFTLGGGDKAEDRRDPKPKYIEAPPTKKSDIQPFKIEAHPDKITDELVVEDDINRQAEEVVVILSKGLRLQDEGMLNFMKGMRVPDKGSNGYRKVSAIVAGGDKTVLAWKQRRVNGRLPLPIVSVNRESAVFNPAKFSPPYIESDRRYLRDRGKVELIYRPVPYNITYTATLWTERKDEAEYVLYQVMQRFNPLANWLVEDEHHKGNIDAHFNGYTDSSDIDVGADEYAKVRYDFSFLVEGWLPLHRKIVPTILGKVESMEVVSEAVFAELTRG